MKYAIVVEPNHHATIELDFDAKGSFTGSIQSDEFGNGAISNGKVVATDLAGEISLGGYNAQFRATIKDKSISGNIHSGWFFDKDFTGTELASTASADDRGN